MSVEATTITAADVAVGRCDATAMARCSRQSWHDVGGCADENYNLILKFGIKVVSQKECPLLTTGTSAAEIMIDARY